MRTTDEATEISFEEGYARLQAISGRLNQEEVPVSEMCDLFAEGKGLDQALTAYLDTQRSRVERIERGEDIQAFRISSPATGRGGGEDDGGHHDVTDSADFERSPPVQSNSASNDDIPF